MAAPASKVRRQLGQFKTLWKVFGGSGLHMNEGPLNQRIVVGSDLPLVA